MSAGAQPTRDRSRPRVRFHPARWALRVLLVAAVFAVGVALGRALEEAEVEGGTQTSVRTLRPLPLAPAVRTVTVTTQDG